MSIDSRLAVLEQVVEDVREDAAKREVKQDEMLVLLQSLVQDQKNIKSFMGGCIFIVSCLSAFFYKFAAPILAWVTKAKTGS